MVPLRHYRTHLKILATFVVFLLSNLAIGEENEAIRELVRVVGVDEVAQWNEAPKLFASIADDSKLKPVASQAIAILEIRQGNYSKAWKILASQSNILEAAPVSLRSGHEKWRLWLLLEAESKDAAESQFKRLVMIAISKELPDAERKDVGSFFGGIFGFLESAGDGSPIARSTVEKGKGALEAIESKNAVEQFRSARCLAEQCNDDLQFRINEFPAAGAEKSEQVLSSSFALLG